jgi:hypothetical protein
LSFVPQIPHGNSSGTPRTWWNFFWIFFDSSLYQWCFFSLFDFAPKVTISHQKIWPNLATSQIGK